MGSTGKDILLVLRVMQFARITRQFICHHPDSGGIKYLEIQWVTNMLESRTC
jgi:hypothetical protein